MKFLVVLLVVTQLTLGENVISPRLSVPFKLIPKWVQKVSSCIQDLVLEGDESVGLPVLDPANIEQETVNFEGYRITVKDFKSEGLGGWTLPVLKDSIKLFPPGAIVYVTALWPEVSIETDYEVDLPLGNGTVQAKGHASFALNDLSFETETDVRLGNKIKSFKIKPHIGSIRFEINDTDINLRRRSSLSGPALARLMDSLNYSSDDLSGNLLDNSYNNQRSKWRKSNWRSINQRNDDLSDNLLSKQRGLPTNDRLQTIIKRFAKCIKE